MTIEDLLREALADHAGSQPHPPDRWAEIEARSTLERRRRQRRVHGLGAVGLAAAVVALFIAVPILSRNEGNGRVVTGTGPVSTTEPSITATSTSPASTTPDSTTPATSPATTAPATTTRAAPTSVTPAPSPFPYQPLWPFVSPAEVATWQRAYRSGGNQPWHLDADATALGFTQGYLGFNEVNKVVSRKIGATEARVSVGYDTGAGPSSISAVIHLVKYGAGPDAPWEVVGTTDAPEFTLTTPRYGASVSSPVTVGGQIMGVDENIKVQVRQQSSAAALGEFCCLPAGNSGAPWTATVTFSGASGTVLTIVASTGGHFQGVERFTVTGVQNRTAPPPSSP